MKNIKQLPKSVHSSLRSSFILFDLPRVVEELVFNSVDAGATKVSVSTSIRSCYVKVEDNGCGITRDGLVLLGEKHATTKLQLLTDMETNMESLGFRGEALGSLSDISLVEVWTKARGKPNAYCKIIKGWKCLFLGIDDQMEGVGTTVVVRDLFYNQPVRRKYLQSSPKSVLHSLKKCVYRTALIHPEVSFKVTDVDSEEELLHMTHSSSPLHLVSDAFGKEVSSSLHELAFSDQGLKLSGYLSGPSDAFSTKAFQYLYINSRFVCKGLVHNLINSLAASSQPADPEPELHSGKRRKTQIYPAFMLNLCCPLSTYDLIFEPAKTTVEFKDWTKVLSFVELVIRKFWEELLVQSPQGKAVFMNEAVPIKYDVHKEGIPISGMTKRKSESGYDQSPVKNPPDTNSIEILTEATNFNCTHDNLPGGRKRIAFPELKRCRKDADCTLTNHTFQSPASETWKSFSPKHEQVGLVKSNNELVMADIDSFLDEDHFMADLSNQIVNSDQKYEMTSLACTDAFHGGDGSFKEGPSLSVANCDLHDIMSVAHGASCGFHKSGARSCSWMENDPFNWAPLFHESAKRADPDNCEKCYPSLDYKDTADGHYCSGSTKYEASFSQKNDDPYETSFGVWTKCQNTGKLDLSPGNSSGLSCLDCFFEETEFSHGHTVQDWEDGPKYEPGDIEWYSKSPCPISDASFDKLRYSRAYEGDGSMMSFKSESYRDPDLIETDDKVLNSLNSCCYRTLSAMSFANNKTCFRDSFSMSESIHCRHNLNELSFEKLCSSGKLMAEEGQLFSDSSDLDHLDSGVTLSGQNRKVVADELRYLYHRHATKIRSKRSSSAPPFYKGKCKFSILNDYLTTVAGKELYLPSDAKASPGNRCSFNILENHSHPSLPQFETAFDEISSPLRECIGEKQCANEVIEMQNNDGKEKGHDDKTVGMDFIEGTMTKWRSGYSHHTDADIQHQNIEHQVDILDISSGLLHLASSSLVPESISKNCFEDARVLLQLDKKFIPVVAGGTLIIIDQHAADERIRLEDLREKVLLGEGKTTTYLDPEQELILPEVGLQLLQIYTDQIQKWGWVFNFKGNCSESFAKNMNLLNKRPLRITLVAVPCILGIDLTDKDLMEFLEQLAETDGSSTLPPSVLRILNFKACRGAIMFGDSLLPSECSLIIEELKATSLCFQCAHGRPTIVPLLDMPSLHEQLARLEMRTGSSTEAWHGLRQHRPSIERAQQRLASAKRFKNG